MGTNDKVWHIFRFKISVELLFIKIFSLIAYFNWKRRIIISKEKKKKKKVFSQVEVSKKASFFKKYYPDL
jgi:hypothetical protein